MCECCGSFDRQLSPRPQTVATCGTCVHTMYVSSYTHTWGTTPRSLTIPIHPFFRPPPHFGAQKREMRQPEAATRGDGLGVKRKGAFFFLSLFTCAYLHIDIEYLSIVYVCVHVMWGEQRRRSKRGTQACTWLVVPLTPLRVDSMMAFQREV